MCGSSWMQVSIRASQRRIGADAIRMDIDPIELGVHLAVPAALS